MFDSLGMDPWSWTSRRRENELTRAIWDLLDPDEEPELAAAATNALLAQVLGELREQIDAPLHGYLTGRSYSPDLIAFDSRHQVRLVVEVKRGAKPQATSMASLSKSPRFSDPLAEEVEAHYAASTTDWHAKLPDWTCDCQVHSISSRRPRHVRAGCWQIDAYRTFSGWVPNDVRLPDPTEVAWVILDSKAPDSPTFSDVITTSVWHVTSFAQFAHPLIEYYRTLPDRHSAARDRVVAVLRMLAS